jgi:hypothetical protein
MYFVGRALLEFDSFLVRVVEFLCYNVNTVSIEEACEHGQDYQDQ